ncbi:MAG: hypothetical protein ACYTF1_13515 [Planctomycetota bacterium]|jgi:hypothetical protein
MANEWDFAKTTGTCAKTGRQLVEGESYYAVLIEHPDALERRDYSLDAWEGPPEGSFCHWRGRIPVKEQKQNTIAIDMEILVQIFIRFEDEESLAKQRFRFMLALLLMRKRVLKLEGTIKEGDQEYWRLRLIKDQSMHQVLNPQLTNEQVDSLGQQLTTFLSGDVEAVESLDKPVDTPAEDSQEEITPVPQADTEVNSTESEDASAAS